MKFVARIQGDAVEYALRDGDKVVAKAVLSPDNEGSGGTLESLHVPPESRGKGFARDLLRRIKGAHKSGHLHVKPRPFGDMPMSIDALKKFYESEGFETIDKRDKMRLKTAESGWQPGDNDSPWQYPGLMQQAQMASPGALARVPRGIVHSPRSMVASLVASQLFSNPKLAAVLVRAFENELSEISAGGSLKGVGGDR